jgi:2-oxoglutarate ferredoxin oxidoreductase subunit alpha
MQGDILKNAVLSHGDTRHPVLMPSSPQECFTMAQDAFDLAERFQTPVFVNTDLDLGMNNWMSDAFEYPDQPIARGKVLSIEDLNRLGEFARYKDVDGDGVPYRTLPGTNHPAGGYFTRGTGHTDKATYSEREDDWVNNMERLARKFETLRANVPKPEVDIAPGARIGFACAGTSRYAVEESCDQLNKEYGVAVSRLRLRAYPYTSELTDFIDKHERVYVVDQNRDAQLLLLMKMDLDPQRVSKLRSVRYFGGMPLDARTVTDDIINQEGLI